MSRRRTEIKRRLPEAGVVAVLDDLVERHNVRVAQLLHDRYLAPHELHKVRRLAVLLEDELALQARLVEHFHGLQHTKQRTQRRSDEFITKFTSTLVGHDTSCGEQSLTQCSGGAASS